MGRSRVSDEQLREAAETATNLRQLLEAVGLVGRGGNYALYRRRLLRIGVTDARFQKAPVRPDPTAAELRAAAARSLSVAGVCRALGLPCQGRWIARMTGLLVQHDVETGHFLGQGWSRGRRDLPPRGRPLEELLQRGSPVKSSALKERLLRAGLLEPVCSRCGAVTWLGSAIPLELDHVNGVADDNRLHNLRLLCPNCHAQTDTYRGRNIGRAGSIVEEAPP
ncbi:MAG: hypothetical protein JWN17_2590 [Frankiales bacterium]|nr:hypothetical protein [Frankiales bacterium]